MTGRLLPAIAFILALVLFFVYINPTYTGSVANSRDAIAQAQSALDAAERFKEKQNELAARKNSIAQSDLDRLDILLPDSVDNVGVILDLTALASRSGLQLASINVAEVPKQSTQNDPSLGPTGSIDLTIVASGTYEGFRSFIAGIERSARILDITSLGVSGSDTGVYSYSLTVRLYWLR
jgi:Tfp pilus assembly protein PilO